MGVVWDIVREHWPWGAATGVLATVRALWPRTWGFYVRTRDAHYTISSLTARLALRDQQVADLLTEVERLRERARLAEEAWKERTP